MIKFSIKGDKPIYAEDFLEFAKKFRSGSFFPEKDMSTFMFEVARRSSLLGMQPIRSDTEEHFVQDLIASGYVSLDENSWN